MKSFAAFIAGTALALSANAATVSFNFGTPTLGLQTIEINQLGVLGLFNSSLGTLDGVSFSVSGAESANITLTNTILRAQDVSATAEVSLNFGSSLGALNALLVGASPFRLSATTGPTTLFGGATLAFGPLLSSFSNTAVSVSGIQGSFAQAGGGNFNVTCNSSSSFRLAGGFGRVDATQATQAGCGAAVTYTYTPAVVTSVPEPGSLALFGAALAGLAVIRRKAKRA